MFGESKMKFKSGLSFVLLLFVAGIWASGSGVKQKCDDEPSQTGPCKAAFLMWRFIRERRDCESFMYGGCMATENMFEEEAECREQCLG